MARRARTGGRRALRAAGLLLLALGVALSAYAASAALWRDPVGDLYTGWQQRRLEGQLHRQLQVELADRAPTLADVRSAARAEERRLRLGQALGRVVAPRIGLRAVFVHGTRWAQDLSRGPGHYPETALPGLGRVTAIAGHRTTFGAPFRRIDDFRRGDRIDVVMPYGDFRYRVVRRQVVAPDDWSILDERGFDELVLTSCHPEFSAAERYVVFARLVAVKPPSSPVLRVPVE
jgi:sortase A